MPLTAGERLGNYQLLAPAPFSDAGECWKAERSDRPGEHVLVMVVSHPAILESLRIANPVANRVEHSCVCRILDSHIGEEPAYLVFEYVVCQPLSRVLVQRRRLSTNDALSVIKPVLSALTMGHSRGQLHLDVRPANIYLAADKRVLLSDFSLGRAVAAAVDQTRRSGGSELDVRRMSECVRYLAPENLSGDPPSMATDIHAVGVMMHEILAGDWRRLRFPIPWVSAYASDAAERATRPDPGERFASVEEFSNAIQAPAGLTLMTGSGAISAVQYAQFSAKLTTVSGEQSAAVKSSELKSTETKSTEAKPSELKPAEVVAAEAALAASAAAVAAAGELARPSALASTGGPNSIPPARASGAIISPPAEIMTSGSAAMAAIPVGASGSGSVIASVPSSAASANASVAGPPTPDAAAAVLGLPPISPDPMKLYLLDDPEHPAKVLKKEVTVFGSRPGVSVRLLTPEVSDTHCAITRMSFGYVLSDLGSETGTYLNGQLVKASMLRDGDEIELAGNRFRIGY